jgi:hypothetical protein
MKQLLAIQLKSFLLGGGSPSLQHQIKAEPHSLLFPLRLEGVTLDSVGGSVRMVKLLCKSPSDNNNNILIYTVKVRSVHTLRCFHCPAN